MSLTERQSPQRVAVPVLDVLQTVLRLQARVSGLRTVGQPRPVQELEEAEGARRGVLRVRVPARLVGHDLVDGVPLLAGPSEDARGQLLDHVLDRAAATIAGDE